MVVDSESFAEQKEGSFCQSIFLARFGYVSVKNPPY